MLSGGTAELTGTALETFLQSVRDLISIGLTAQDISDDLLNSLIYFRGSELNLITLLGYSDDDDDNPSTPTPYETKLTNDPIFKSRAEVWIATRMAARILPALGQILEEGILNERVRYQEINIEERIRLLLGIGDDAIRPELPGGSGSAIYAKACRYVAY